MSKVVIISDTHLHAYSGSPVDAEGGNARLGDVVAAMDAALATAISVGAVAIVHAGDLFHDRKGVRHEVLHRAGEWVDRVHSAGIDLHILVGNHDLSEDCRTFGPRVLSGRVRVYSKPTLVEIGGVAYGFSPYATDPEAVRRDYALLAKKGCECVIGHLGIGDPRFANCVPVDYEVPGRISLDDLSPESFDRIFLGHYHLRQRLTDRVMYIGSPLQLSFGETCHEKGWLVFDHDTGEVREIVNDSSPEYHVVTDISVLPSVPADDFVWVRAANREDEVAAAEATRGRVGIRIDRAPAPSAPARIDPSARGEKLLRSYVQTVRPDLLADEVEALVQSGIKFYHTELP